MTADPGSGRKPIDVHVHIVGNGRSGTGCWLNLKGSKSLLARYMVHHLGFPQNCLQGDLDIRYIARLREFVRESSFGSIVILAHENVYDDRGDVMEGAGSFYVPNEYILRLAREHPEFVPAASIHPGRRDALQELDRCIEGGAAMLKFLPNCQNIDCANPAYRPFWEKMVAADMPLLAHTGGELSVPVVRAEYANPERLRLPLECGVKVIAAHSGTNSGIWDPNYMPVLERMLLEFPNLYCDNSALCSPLRSRHLRRCLREPFVSRMVHGSDLPIPVSGLWLWLRGLVDFSTYRKWDQASSILERDYQLKRAIGFPEATFTRLHDLLPRRISEAH